MRICVHSFETMFGIIRTAATETALAMVDLPGRSEEEFRNAVNIRFADAEIAEGGRINYSAREQITAYLGGKLTEFTLPLDLKATPFQAEVLREVAGIPYGHTKTYSQIAAAVGTPKACRAVGTANARNCLPLVIPCHRVVATHGLGGYGGGLEMKRRLLHMEGALPESELAQESQDDCG